MYDDYLEMRAQLEHYRGILVFDGIKTAILSLFRRYSDVYPHSHLKKGPSKGDSVLFPVGSD